MSHSPTLTVHLPAIVQNWQTLRGWHGGRETAAVVKADAYGLGAVEAVGALQEAGCTRFFVATLAEGITLLEGLDILGVTSANESRSGGGLGGKTPIQFYIFQGILNGEEKDYLHYGLHPVINNLQGLQRWGAVQRKHPDALPAAVHIDSGMNRLGLSLTQLQAHLEEVQALRADLLMTHYACASTLSHPLNMQQYAVMQQAHTLLPHLKSCYANSAGHFLSAPMQGEVSRPGCALYGINPLDDAPSAMQPVCTLRAPILQVRTLEEAMTIGYGATETLPKGAKLLTAGIGYADGIHRHASHSLHSYIGDYDLPLVGRVTMDMCCFDASSVPDAVLEHAEHITLMDTTYQTVDDLARIYGTIGYEVLTSIGARVKREYEYV